MTLRHDYQKLIERVAAAVPLPPVESVLLPPIAPPPEKKDEFGFVVLADGSVGPFYLCLDDTYQRLRQRLAVDPVAALAPAPLAAELGGQDVAASALALGAYNAISQYLMGQSGFDPAAGGKGSDSLHSARRIGMVGYFPPLVERMRARGLTLTVIEKQPERVPDDDGITLSTTADALAECDQVLCTASTLINDTIDEILDSCPADARVELIGPSASGLPDPLFSRGVSAVGGIVIDDPERLEAAVANCESWSKCGRKYSLHRDDYPGLERFL